jgi:4-hydroxyphenylpyruvate dioxygenase-like putative hemolysin
VEDSPVTAQDVEDIEFYLIDERSTDEYFVSSFGFTRIAEASDAGAHSSPETSVRSLGHTRLLDYVAVCVESGTLEDCADFYASGFGLPRYSSEYVEVGEQALDSIVVRSPSCGITVTILEQDSAKKPGQIPYYDMLADRLPDIREEISGPGCSRVRWSEHQGSPRGRGARWANLGMKATFLPNPPRCGSQKR